MNSKQAYRCERLLMFGGNANNGANDGIVYSNSNNAFSNTNSNIGSRHTLAEYAIRDAGRLYWRHPGHRKPWSVVTQRCVGHECQNNGTLRLSSVVGNMVLVGRRRFGRSMQNAMQGLVCKVCKVCKVYKVYKVDSLFFSGCRVGGLPDMMATLLVSMFSKIFESCRILSKVDCL